VLIYLPFSNRRASMYMAYT